MPVSEHEQSKATVIYDGDCPFCIARIKEIRAHDREHNLEFVPRQAPEAEERFPQIVGIDLEEGILAVDSSGKVSVAADAMYEIWRRLPLSRPFTWLYNVPGIKQAVRLGYRVVAMNRKRLGRVCTKETCHID